MANAIEQADKNGVRLFIGQRRNYGKTAAILLARNTQDIPHEVIEPKLLPENKNQQP